MFAKTDIKSIGIRIPAIIHDHHPDLIATDHDLLHDHLAVAGRKDKEDVGGGRRRKKKRKKLKLTK